ncbi:hypothetical protein FGO68_gene6201 [Halteria grandinella]|uniref:Uncharacterized protein n=1 Tax=Halteria grandinella TaxID=5974 RepID=A0A8J8NGD9_HALGN|nr:hypothetical protein FGO68_gene6201 [Halteria grandinella]
MEDTPQSSSDSDFKKSLDFERQGDPQFDTDKQSSAGGPNAKGKSALKLNLEGVKLGFPANVARRIPDNEDILALDDIQARIDGSTFNSRLHTPNNASQSGRMTNRDGPISYRKIFPEQILTQRGQREDGQNQTNVTQDGGYQTAVSDRSRAGMLQKNSKKKSDGRRSPMFRQENSREKSRSSGSDSSQHRNGAENEVNGETQSNHNITSEDAARERRDSQTLELTGGKKHEGRVGRQQAYRNSDELDYRDVQLEYPTNPQSMRREKSSHRKGMHKIQNDLSGSQTPESFTSDQDQDFDDFRQDYEEEEVGDIDIEEDKNEGMENSIGTNGLRELIGDIKNLPRGTTDTFESRDRNNFMQQTFKLKEQLRDVQGHIASSQDQVQSDAFDLTIHKHKDKLESDSPKSSSIQNIKESQSSKANHSDGQGPEQNQPVVKRDDTLNKPQRRQRKNKVFI